MGAGISKTLKDKDMDRIFTEVSHDEKLKLSGQGELRLFHLLIRDKQFYWVMMFIVLEATSSWEQMLMKR